MKLPLLLLPKTLAIERFEDQSIHHANNIVHTLTVPQSFWQDAVNDGNVLILTISRPQGSRLR